MTPMQKKIYHSHPAVGAQLLSQIREIETAVIQGVAQHHERRNGKGFPGKIDTGRMIRIAEIVCLSDQFVQILVQAKSNPLLDPFQEVHRRVLDGFSFALIDAFCLIFLQKK